MRVNEKYSTLPAEDRSVHIINICAIEDIGYLPSEGTVSAGGRDPGGRAAHLHRGEGGNRTAAGPPGAPGGCRTLCAGFAAPTRARACREGRAGPGQVRAPSLRSECSERSAHSAQRSTRPPGMAWPGSSAAPKLPGPGLELRAQPRAHSWRPGWDLPFLARGQGCPLGQPEGG